MNPNKILIINELIVKYIFAEMLSSISEIITEEIKKIRTEVQ